MIYSDDEDDCPSLIESSSSETSISDDDMSAGSPPNLAEDSSEDEDNWGNDYFDEDDYYDSDDNGNSDSLSSVASLRSDICPVLVEETSSSSEEDSVNEQEEFFYCHGCDHNVSVTLRDGQYACNECSFTFVERLGQELDVFLPYNNSNNTTSSSSSNQTIAGGVTSGGSSRSRGNGRAGGGRSAPSRTIPIQSQPNNNIFNNNNNINNRSVRLPIRFNALMGDSMGVGVGHTHPLMGMLGGGGTTFDDLLHHILMNETSHEGVPPASNEFIESLRDNKVDENTNLVELGECSITQEPYEIGDIVCALPCNHSFKREHIISWLKIHNTCPTCRTSFHGESS
jgi:hypothetical protein